MACIKCPLLKQHVAAAPDSPFFLYSAVAAPHIPWRPPDFVKGKRPEIVANLTGLLETYKQQGHSRPPTANRLTIGEGTMEDDLQRMIPGDAFH